MAYQKCKGTQLKMSISSVYTAVPQCKTMTPPSMEASMQETTDLDATAKTFMGTILDNGEVPFSLEWDPTNSVHGAMFTAFQALTESSWYVVFSTSTPKTLAFAGTISKWNWGEYTPEGIQMVNGAIKVSGAATLS